jgi:hypothetical protein
MYISQAKGLAANWYVLLAISSQGLAGTYVGYRF